MKTYDYDLFVIGAGSGGVRAARVAAQLGARVAIAEERHFGGTCVNVGCVPKKFYVYAASIGHELHDLQGFGWSVGEVEHDWIRLNTNKDREIVRLRDIYRQRQRDSGVVIFDGRATIHDPHTLRINEQLVSAERILVATGSRPMVPDLKGRKHILTSDDMFALESLPSSIIINGGGYIAVEFAGILQGLGVDTTLIYRGPLFLRGFDDDCRRLLSETMSERGIALRFNETITEIEKTDNGIRARLKGGDTVTADAVLYATGRIPNTAGLGLENAGLNCATNGSIAVDERFQSEVPSIYALGDVINRVQLTPVAIAEAMCFTAMHFGDQTATIDYTLIPSAIFSQPAIATVGLNEHSARQRGLAVDIYLSVFRSLKASLTTGREKTLVKLVVERATDQVLGAQMVGSEAPEVIQGIAIALRAGATKADFDATLGLHPTSAEEFVTLREPRV